MIKTPCAILVTATILLTGCNSGVSSVYTGYSLNKKFDRQPANEFFHSYGFPEARFVQPDGEIEYVWASNGRNIFPPQAKPVTYYSGKGIYQVVPDEKPGIERQYCELRIFTGMDENIIQINISVDSIGKWSESRCSEIF